MFTIFGRILWIPTSAGIAYARNATGPLVHLQWKLFFSMKLPNHLFVEEGMWDMVVYSAKSSNPPLSKEIFLQEHGLSYNHWEDEVYGDHEHDEDADDGSDEDN